MAGVMNYSDEHEEEDPPAIPKESDSADEAIQAFGDLPEAYSQRVGTKRMPIGLEQSKPYEAPEVEELWDQLTALRDEVGHFRVLNGDVLDKVALIAKKVCDRNNQRTRIAREDARTSQGHDSKVLRKLEPGQIIFAPTPESLANQKVPIEDESRICSKSGDFSVKIRPQMIVAVKQDSYVTVVGYSRSGRPIDQKYLKQHPEVARTYIRIQDVTKPVKEFDGARDAIRVVDGGFLRESAVLDGTWLNEIRKGDVTGTTKGHIEPGSVINLVEFLLEAGAHPLRSLLRQFGLKFDIRTQLIESHDWSPENTTLGSLRDLEAYELNQSRQAAYLNRRGLAAPQKRSFAETNLNTRSDGDHPRKRARSEKWEQESSGRTDATSYRPSYGNQSTRKARSSAIAGCLADPLRKPTEDRRGSEGRMPSTGLTNGFADLPKPSTSSSTQAGAGGTNEIKELFPNFRSRPRHS